MSWIYIYEAPVKIALHGATVSNITSFKVHTTPPESFFLLYATSSCSPMICSDRIKFEAMCHLGDIRNLPIERRPRTVCLRFGAFEI